MRTFHRRSLFYHWRTNVAVLLGVMIAAAVFTGALVVGDSMRGSLRETAMGRLGRVTDALVGNRFFREQLASDLISEAAGEAASTRAAPVIVLSGAASHATTRSRANRISIIGVDERFWALKGPSATVAPQVATDRSVILNTPLADELGAEVGDDVLIRVGKPAAISPETLLGRRDDTTSTLRLTVRQIIRAEDLGAFSLRPRQFQAQNAFIPLSTLQRQLDQPDRANAILVAGAVEGTTSDAAPVRRWQQSLEKLVTLEDIGMTVRIDHEQRYLSLESEAMLIEASVASAAMEAADALQLPYAGIQSYLANSMVKLPDDDANRIPYSTVAAADWLSAALRKDQPEHIEHQAGNDPSDPPATSNRLMLSRWAADDLGVEPGDRVALAYFVTGDFGRLETRSAEFEVTGIPTLTGWAADPGLVPTYPGVTDVENMADWDPPFPVDFDLIRDKDEAYWDRYRTTPKAFIWPDQGRRLWGKDADRFGLWTSIRMVPPTDDAALVDIAARFEERLLGRLDLAKLGLAFEPVREQLRAAGAGTTDFGGLFIGFSFFLIVSAAMLVALLFRLGVERRSSEVGLLLAAGFSPRSVTRVLVVQGAVLAGLGSAAGLFVAVGYAWFMLAGLRTWWAEAANAPFLRLHATPQSLAVGFVAGFGVAMLSIVWSVRGLTRLSARSLLAGTVAAGRGSSTSSRGRASAITAAVAFVAAVIFALLPRLTDAMPAAPSFFVGGASMLTAGLALFAHRLGGEGTGVISTPGASAFVSLGIRNARRQRGRSILTAGLIASATFLIAAIGAFRLDVDTDAAARNSATGGFALYGESAAPLMFDPNTPEGQESLSIGADAIETLSDTEIIPFRLRPGDESGCINLYRPTKPRVLGASDRFVQRGGFRFSAIMAESQAEKDNPWTLLNRNFDDGAVPAIGDEAAVKWQLHSGLGKDLVVQDDRGGDVCLRFVALLSGSALQDELVVATARFEALFPSISGHGFFLIEAPAAAAADVERTLERELSPFGFDVGSTRARLAAYHAVQNTYLSTFQTLGGFGLILGTVGLAAVLLRNVWERRGELALMRAVGFSRTALGWIVLMENVALLLVGLLTGVVSAALAIAPHIAARPESIPWGSLGLTLSGVLLVGVGTGVAAMVPTLRAPLLGALRAE
ncbi:MAG: ABC transporter permease [Phycisphaerae bacterium]|jgi:hypothetical protein